jgi:cytochrome c oxidase assembly protein subunit 15
MLWLAFMVLLVALMILLGGATRLTNSGLSITEWRPVSGALPPMSDAAWASEFEKYRQIPEFSAENPDMNISGFKFIYFMEWSHRQLGRFIGVAYFLPLLLLLGFGRIRREHRFRFISILFLIGAQGAIGWWMVSSGLGAGRVDVSQYRLATHLAMAFIILGMLFWTFLDVRQNWPTRAIAPKLRIRMNALLALVFLQVIAGAFVAGTHAGRAYNTWPLMDGGFVPQGYSVMQPFWLNIFENTASIQFNHRILGYLIFFLMMWILGAIRKERLYHLFAMGNVMMFVILGQIVLGITALLTVVDLPYALSHQAGAIVVFLCAIWATRRVRVRF